MSEPLFYVTLALGVFIFFQTSINFILLRGQRYLLDKRLEELGRQLEEKEQRHE